MFDRAALGKGLTAGAAIALLASALPLGASAAKPGHRVSHEQQRIQTGYQHGQITQGEYNRDERRLQAINAQREAWLKAQGGKLTDAQKAQLNAELNHSSHDIYWSKHNAMTQPGTAPHGHQSWGGKLPPAGSPGYIGARIDRELARLHDGALNGTLTQPEYNHDLAAIRQIQAQRDAWMKAQGGTLTQAQQAQLQSELDAASGQIFRTKHNTSNQPGA